MLVGLSVNNFKGIQHARVEFKHFNVLVGPNAGGKSTLLEVIDFVHDCLALSPRLAVEKRAPDFRDLTFMRKGKKVEICLFLDLGLYENTGIKSSLIHDNYLAYLLWIDQDESKGVFISGEGLYPISKKVFENGFSVAGLKKELLKYPSTNDKY